MADFYLAVGDSVTFSKTVSESDVYLFAGITGDFSPNHIDEEAMKGTAYGQRVAHGALLVGYMSTASTRILDVFAGRDGDETPVSLGYDRIRFLAPVFFGDTVTVDYAIESVDIERRRTTGEISVTNQRGELVAVATHILKWVAA